MKNALSMLLAAAVLFAPCATRAAATAKAPVFTVPGIDEDMDLHGDLSRADLVIYAAGNQWMVLPSLIGAFKRAHPEVRYVFYETLPPGLLAQQITSAGRLRVGDLLVDARPDLLLAGKRRMAEERALGVVTDAVPYASNTLAIMVRRGNPKGVHSLRDLGRTDVRVAMPNPKTEGIAKQIEKALVKTGGTALDREVMQTKVRAGTTILTRIHHRETPIWILDGKADAGPVWISEALYQERIGSGLEAVRIAENENVSGTYEAAVASNPKHPAAAQAFVLFLLTAQAQAIYRAYGFSSPTSSKGGTNEP
ncbi:MAG TPA: substrate-binding domain-containing protein [Candidatus Baltobacteraceae bacterium]|jgi:ABC-type molybdate transport system substrate-binding protein|nr:substrate-binding domain-containing protein [Candidatus Baltobacteraceae bacterium]